MPTTPTPLDEWIAGESPSYERHYVVHTREPRFIAEFLEIRTGTAALHQVVEIDPLPAGDAARLQNEAAEALAEWLDWSWVQSEKPLSSPYQAPSRRTEEFP